MNAFQTCRNTSDALPLYLPQQLYLKPIARLTVSLQLPPKTMGKSISNWEVMEKLRLIVKPDEFATLKVTKTTLELIRFEAEVDDKTRLEIVVDRLNNKSIKLKDFSDVLRLKAAEAKLDFPSRHVWDSYFREAKEMDEMKPGERPDTVHISNLPIKWFVPYHLSGEEDIKPSEKIFFRVFEKFGRIRYVDIPICDPYRNKMKSYMSGLQTFSFDEEHFFEGYIQFKDYVGFTNAMDAFRGMKLLHKEDGVAYTINIYVDFDKTKHLSDASIRRREIVRDRLIMVHKDREEKESREREEKERLEAVERQKLTDIKNAKEKRRREREEKRKARILSQLKVTGTEEINEKIAREEKKLVQVQRKLEAIRLVEELFRRIKDKKDTSINSLRNMRLGDENLSRYKCTSELEVQEQREKLHKAIEGRAVLKSMLSGGPRIHKHSSGSSSSDSEPSDSKKQNRKNATSAVKVVSPNYVNPDPLYPVPDWYGFPPSNGVYPYHTMGPLYPLRGHPPGYFPFPSRGRGFPRTVAGPSRGLAPSMPRRGRGGYNPRHRGGFQAARAPHYPPELEDQYLRYFQKFLHDHDNRDRRSYSKSRSRSRSRHRNSSRYSRSRSRSSTRSRSYSRSRRSRSRKSRSLSRSRSYSRHSKRRSRSRSRRSSHRARRDFSRSRRTTSVRRRSKSRSRSVGTSTSRNKEKLRSRSPSYKSIDSSKFISPSRLRMPRSKSWSMPREQDNTRGDRRSWSNTRSPEKKD